MKIALTGKAGSGAAELFAVLTGRDPNEHRGSRLASVKVPDPRIEALAEIWQPKKKVYVEAQFADLSEEGLAGADSMAELTACEGVIQVVASQDIIGTSQAGPASQIADFAADLLLRDQMVVEKRLARMQKANEKGSERDLLEMILPQLEAGKAVRQMGLDPAQMATLSGYAFASALPLLIALNVDESKAADAADPDVLAAAHELDADVVALAVSLESEIAQLDEEDQNAFLQDLGLKEAARGRFLREAYKLLNLQTFLTMGADECRAWSVRKGAKAPETGRRIHSDIERGFIRVEVIPFADFVELKSEAACRKAGKMRVEGKDYLVQEGDILNFRFNV